MKLSNSQNLAVRSGARYSLVLAGAGSGKTSTIIERVKYILAGNNHIKGWNLLVLTFSNRAAFEIIERMQSIKDGDKVIVKTFHSFALGILRRYGESDTLLDEEESVKKVKEAFAEIRGEVDYKGRADFNRLMSEIQNAKDKLQTPPGPSSFSDNHELMSLLYQRYEEKLREVNAMDFGDIFIRLRLLFLEMPNICNYYQNRFKYILVDEYQDISFSQYSLLRMLLQRQCNSLYCVADDDQIIYEWRGASISNTLFFQRNFPGAEIFHLETNYRSRKVVIDASNHLIRGNKNRYKKETIASDKEAHIAPVNQHDKVEIHKFKSCTEEAYGIAAIIEEMLKSDSLNNECKVAILFRQHMHMHKVKAALSTFDIEYEDLSKEEEKNFGKKGFFTGPQSDEIETKGRSKLYLMTVHSAKGMEFDIVFLPCWEEGIMPMENSELEGERRLAYVGMTRAKSKVIISHANSRYIYSDLHLNRMSRFISELPSEHCIIFDYTSP